MDRAGGRAAARRSAACGRDRHLDGPPGSALVVGLLPPRGAPLAERDLGGLHPGAGGALVTGAARTTYFAPPGHQRPGELRTPRLGYRRIGGSPPAAVDHDVPSVRTELGRFTHPTTVASRSAGVRGEPATYRRRMGHLLLVLVPLGLAAGVSPVMLTEQTVLLAGPGGTRTGWAYAAGTATVLVGV